jgi:hypothetical protein
LERETGLSYAAQGAAADRRGKPASDSTEA